MICSTILAQTLSRVRHGGRMAAPACQRAGVQRGRRLAAAVRQGAIAAPVECVAPASRALPRVHAALPPARTPAGECRLLLASHSPLSAAVVLAQFVRHVPTVCVAARTAGRRARAHVHTSARLCHGRLDGRQGRVAVEARVEMVPTCPTAHRSVLGMLFAACGVLQLCRARAFVCELCADRDDVLFPFHLDRVRQCTVCGACAHGKCVAFVMKRMNQSSQQQPPLENIWCQRCERIRYVAIAIERIMHCCSARARPSHNNGAAE